jgi:hypothetical protein
MSSMILQLPTDMLLLHTSKVGIDMFCVSAYSKCRRTVINSGPQVSLGEADEGTAFNRRDG